MRTLARKKLFTHLEKSGWQWVVFNEEEPKKNNGIVESIIDAMEDFKNVSMQFDINLFYAYINKFSDKEKQRAFNLMFADLLNAGYFDFLKETTKHIHI